MGRARWTMVMGALIGATLVAITGAAPVAAEVDPLTVTGVTATPGPGSIRVEWSAAADPVQNYRVQTSLDGNDFTFADITPATSSTLDADTTLHVRVRAWNGTRFGPWSETVIAESLVDPLAVADVTATPGPGSIRVEWSAAADPVQNYRVQTSLDGNDFTFADITPATSSTLDADTTLHVRVRAWNGTRFGPWSETVTATPEEPPPAGPSVDYDPADYVVEGQPLPDYMGNNQFGEGAFRTVCNPGQLLFDDPIVLPGQPGASHLHQFFGNLAADADSTAASLLAGGDSTCHGGPINRTAYWTPALLDPSQGVVIVPKLIVVYYKNEPYNDPQPLPAGLRMIAGYDLANQQPGDSFSWKCEANGYDSSDTIGDCGPGELIVSMQFPECWDGANLDSTDHRSHMTPRVTLPDWSVGCPDSHPVQLPRITYNIHYEVQVGDDTTNWRLASDINGGTDQPGGSTFHGDWFGGWNEEFSNRWFQGCIIGFRNCNDGELGDGGRLINAAPGLYEGRTPIPSS